MIDRRGLLKRLGLLGAGAVAGVGARPAADAVEDLRAPDAPLTDARLDGDHLHVDLAPHADLSVVRAVYPDDRGYLDAAPDGTQAQLLVWESIDNVRVKAYRGDYPDLEEVQEMEVSR